jgi:hypothetical protein
MFAAFAILGAIIALTPIIAVVHGPIGIQSIEIFIAAVLALTAISLPIGEGRHLSKVIVPVIVCLAVPAIWMVIQTIPLPVPALVHPIWASTAAALGKELTGSISIDPGQTLISLADYGTTIGVLIGAAAITIDRTRAHSFLLLLTGTAALAGLSFVLVLLALPSLVEVAKAPLVQRTLAAQCALSVPISAAATWHVFEVYERRRSRAEVSFAGFAVTGLACLTPLGICLCALVYSGQVPLLLIAVFGLGIVVAIIVVRRLGVGILGGGALLGTGLIIMVAVLAARPATYGDITFRYATSSGPQIELAERLLSDTPWTGSGAGTYEALAPMYDDGTRNPEQIQAPTAAAKAAVELGKPMLWLVVVMGIACIGLLVRGSLRRGRDSLYSAAGAGSTAVLILESFNDLARPAGPVVLLAAAAFGLGLAQSVSRTVQSVQSPT